MHPLAIVYDVFVILRLRVFQLPRWCVCVTHSGTQSDGEIADRLDNERNGLKLTTRVYYE